MLKRAFITTMLIVAVVFLVSACGQNDGSSAPEVEKKGSYSEGGGDTKAQLPEGHPPMPSDNEAYKFRDALKTGGQRSSGVSTGGSMSAKGKDVRLSDALKAKWSTVEIEIAEAGKKKVITVTVGKKTKVGKTYSLLVDAFIPEYTMFEDYIGTRGDDPKNPAIRVELFQGDKSLAKGWVFKKLPDFNSYQNAKVGVVLLTPKETE